MLRKNIYISPPEYHNHPDIATYLYCCWYIARKSSIY